MAYSLVSDCHQAYTIEEPTESNTRPYDIVCSLCGDRCKRIRVGEPDGTPRTEEQAYQDALKAPTADFGHDSEGKPRVPETPLGGSESPATGFETRDGLLYHNGILVGKALSAEDIK